MLDREGGSVSVLHVTREIADLLKALSQYVPERNYSLDETELFFELIPRRTCVLER